MPKRAPVNRMHCQGIVKSGKNKGKPKKEWRFKKGHVCPVQAKRMADVGRYKTGGCAVPVRNAYEVGYAKGRKTCDSPMLNGPRRRRRRRRR